MTAAATTATTTSSTIPRKIAKVFLAREQAEGAGATVRRSIGTANLRNFTPFLMLDHFTIHPGAGFPDHPHRGQETITYLLQGAVDHEDFAGNAGTIEAGDLQFMTAGRGIMHAEMPNQHHDDIVGLQLWVDLPQRLKECEPRYRDLRAREIPTIEVDDGKVTVKIISGRSHGTDSVKELAYTPVWILDVEIRPGGRVEQELPAGWNAFAYTLSGKVDIASSSSSTSSSSTSSPSSPSDEGKQDEFQSIDQFHNVVFDAEGDKVVARVPEAAAEPARFVIVAGQPLDQKVVQYGPFVVNSTDEVMKAMRDFQSYSNGFERGKGWRSAIGQSMRG